MKISLKTGAILFGIILIGVAAAVVGANLIEERRMFNALNKGE